MEFNKYKHLERMHATLSPSQGSWLRYNRDELITRLDNAKAAEYGTMLHEFASTAINNGIRLAGKESLAMFVNDAIRYNMKSEVLLVYSNNIFGTADAISYSEKRKRLRIHDLKTGRGKVKPDQLYIYAALFCLEYGVNPHDIHMNLRYYQHGEIFKIDEDPVYIDEIAAHIIQCDLIIQEYNLERE